MGSKDWVQGSLVRPRSFLLAWSGRFEGLGAGVLGSITVVLGGVARHLPALRLGPHQAIPPGPRTQVIDFPRPRRVSCTPSVGPATRAPCSRMGRRPVASSLARLPTVAPSLETPGTPSPTTVCGIPHPRAVPPRPARRRFLAPGQRRQARRLFGFAGGGGG